MREMNDVTELQEGDLVSFLAQNGREDERNEAKTLLDTETVYELTSVRVSNWSTAVQLKGVEGSFNSVMFKMITPV